MRAGNCHMRSGFLQFPAKARIAYLRYDGSSVAAAPCEATETADILSDNWPNGFELTV